MDMYTLIAFCYYTSHISVFYCLFSPDTYDFKFICTINQSLSKYVWQLTNDLFHYMKMLFGPNFCSQFIFEFWDDIFHIIPGWWGARDMVSALNLSWSFYDI